MSDDAAVTPAPDPLEALLAECAEACTSGCHSDDCEHHGHILALAQAAPPPEGLRESLYRVTAMLEEECYPLAENPENGIEYNEGVCAERGRIAGILDSLLSPEAEGLKPHPGSPHEFVTRCMACGENGFLNVAVITHNERVTISEGEW